MSKKTLFTFSLMFIIYAPSMQSMFFALEVAGACEAGQYGASKRSDMALTECCDESCCKSCCMITLIALAAIALKATESCEEALELKSMFGNGKKME